MTLIDSLRSSRCGLDFVADLCTGYGPPAAGANECSDVDECALQTHDCHEMVSFFRVTESVRIFIVIETESHVLTAADMNMHRRPHA